MSWPRPCECGEAIAFLGYLGATYADDTGDDTEPGTGTGTRHPDTGDTPATTTGGSPGVPAHPDHWEESNLSRSGWYYIILSGDYLWGIAQTYLNDGARWKEFWNYQSPAFRQAHPDPNNIPVGTKMEATPEMIEKAKALGVLQGKEPGLLHGSSTWLWIAGGAVVVGLATIGGTVYAVRRRQNPSRRRYHRRAA